MAIIKNTKGEYVNTSTGQRSIDKAEVVQPRQPKVLGVSTSQKAKVAPAVYSSSKALQDYKQKEADFGQILSQVGRPPAALEQPTQDDFSTVLSARGIDTSFGNQRLLARKAGIPHYTGAKDQREQLKTYILAQNQPSQTDQKLDEVKNLLSTKETPTQTQSNLDVGSKNLQTTTVSQETVNQTPSQYQISERTQVYDTEDPFEAELQKIDTKIDSSYKDFSRQLNRISTGSFTLTGEEQATLSATQQALERARDAQLKANEAYVNQVRQAGFRSGSEYTPEISTGFVAAAVNEGVQRIADLDIAGLQVIENLKNDFRDRRYSAAKENYTALQNILNAKKETVYSLYETAREQERLMLKAQQDIMNAALEAESFTLSEGQSRYTFNPETGRYEQVAYSPKTYKPAVSSGGGFLGASTGNSMYTSDLDAVIGNTFNLISSQNGKVAFKADISRARNDVDKINSAATVILKNSDADLKKNFRDQVDGMRGVDKAIALLDKGVKTGVLRNGTQYVYNIFGKDFDPNIAAINSYLTSAIQPYRVSVTGAAWGDQEDVEYDSLFGSTKYSPEELKNRLVRIKEILRDKAVSGLSLQVAPISGTDVFETGQFTPQDVEEFTPASGEGRIRVVSPDGEHGTIEEDELNFYLGLGFDVLE